MGVSVCLVVFILKYKYLNFQFGQNHFEEKKWHKKIVIIPRTTRGCLVPSMLGPPERITVIYKGDLIKPPRR